MSKVVWIEDDLIHISGVGQVAICLRQFRRRPLDRQQKKTEDYKIELAIVEFEMKHGIRFFTDEDLRIYYVHDSPVVALPKGK